MGSFLVLRMSHRPPTTLFKNSQKPKRQNSSRVVFYHSKILNKMGVLKLTVLILTRGSPEGSGSLTCLVLIYTNRTRYV